MEDAPPERRPDPLSWAVFALLAIVYRWGRCPSYGPGDSPRLVSISLYMPGRDPLALLGHALSKLPFVTTGAVPDGAVTVTVTVAEWVVDPAVPVTVIG